MIVRIKLFAVAKELAGRDEVTVEAPENATVDDVRTALIGAFPKLAKVVPHALWAVDARYVPADARVTQQSEVALIPPVSGG
jgi:molybdopterin converting factor subunit 1